MAEFPTYKEMGKKVAEEALDGYIYKGKTIREWIDDIVVQTQWIPVSERLPKKSGDYLCTFGGNNLTGIDHYTTKSDAKEIFDEPEEYAGWRSQNVIAWMPLPEPYEAESEG